VVNTDYALKLVTLMMQNIVMKYFFINVFKLVLIFMSVGLTYSAHADVYVDLSQSDEISISNTQNNENYTFRIAEHSSANADFDLQNNRRNKQGLSDNKNLPYNNEVLVAANETAIDPALIHAVITVESKHNPHAQSKKGAYGLMQLMPETSNRFNVLNRKDPKQNILAGARYLRELLDLFKGDISLSLAAYNAGPGAVQKYGGRIPPYKETLDYVPKVLKYYRQYY
jgi:soluble lytic murein transglycosylase-like protein